MCMRLLESTTLHGVDFNLNLSILLNDIECRRLFPSFVITLHSRKRENSGIRKLRLAGHVKCKNLMPQAVFAALAAAGRTYARKRQAQREDLSTEHPPPGPRGQLEADVSDLTNRPVCCFFAICCCMAFCGRSANLFKGGSNPSNPEQEHYAQARGTFFSRWVHPRDPDLRGAFS
ncbi:unnamed protein product [Amoebophrya sp. A25]|nr:unnamed protein product [Amoebophrya sp. A25]|eukprot:GSA25T00021445001.1